MDIVEIINKINSKEATRSEIGEQLGMSDTSISRAIKDAGYKYDNKTKKYFLASPNPGSQKEIKPLNQQSKKKEINPTNKQEKKEIRMMEVQEERKVKKKVTYELDEDLHWELRMEAFKRKKNVSELVESAIRQYLRNEK